MKSDIPPHSSPAAPKLVTVQSLGIAMLAVGIVSVSAAPHYHRTRPAVRCALPERDYQFRGFSQREQTLSRTALLLLAPVPAASPLEANDLAKSRGQIKSFQFVEKPRLAIDHCSLSRLSVLLSESGHWSVSLRADQNPLAPPPTGAVEVTTIERARLVTEHLLRNEFHVQVRCYATGGAVDLAGPLGQPMMVPLKLSPFWVQKEQPRFIHESGRDDRIAKYFDLIDRVELEFAYSND